MWKWQFLIKLIRILSGSHVVFQRRLRTLRQAVQEAINRYGCNDAWMASLAYPKQPIRHGSVDRSQARVAIVMQGPVRKQDDFTLETVRHYRLTAPESLVVVSTWQTEDAAVVASLEDAGAVVVCNADPPMPGRDNINRQIVSTCAGLRVAKERGYQYAMKTRTDARVYAPRFADFLLGLLAAFPMKPGLGQQQRIAVLDLATRLYIPNHPSDILMFGQCDDLLNYWSAPFSQHTQPSGARRHGGLWSAHVPEVYVCEDYFSRLNVPHERRLQAWWQNLADHFVVVDRLSIEHFWPKHHYVLEHRYHPDATQRSLALCSFRDWLNLQQGVFPQVDDDQRLQDLLVDGVLPIAA